MGEIISFLLFFIKNCLLLFSYFSCVCACYYFSWLFITYNTHTPNKKWSKCLTDDVSVLQEWLCAFVIKQNKKVIEKKTYLRYQYKNNCLTNQNQQRKKEPKKIRKTGKRNVQNVFAFCVKIACGNYLCWAKSKKKTKHPTNKSTEISVDQSYTAKKGVKNFNQKSFLNNQNANSCLPIIML